VILKPKEPPRKATRTAFTNDEDEALAKFLYKQDMGKSGTAVYALMEKQYPNHSLQSWRERYKNNKHRIEALIQVYRKIVEKRRDDHEDVIFSDDEVDRVVLNRTAAAKGKGKAKEQEKGKKPEIPPPRLVRTVTRESLSPGPSVAAISKQAQAIDEESQEKDELESQNRQSLEGSRSASPEESDQASDKLLQISKKRKRLSGPEPLEFVAAGTRPTHSELSIERPTRSKKHKTAHAPTAAEDVAPVASSVAPVSRGTAPRNRFLPSSSPILGAEQPHKSPLKQASLELPEQPVSARKAHIVSNGVAKPAKRNPLLSRALPASLYDKNWTSKHLYTLLSMSQFEDLQHACSGSEQIAFDLAQQLAKGSQSITKLSMDKGLRSSFWTPEEDEVVLALLKGEEHDAKQVLLAIHGLEKVEKRKVYLSSTYEDNLEKAEAGLQRFPFDI